ncbi:MAG: HDOD domain-containing protein [Planctomycetota bacterium]
MLHTSLPPIKIDERTFLKEHFHLAPLPGTLTRILAVINSQNGNAAEVEKLIATDAVMTSTVLKVVNSAYYALAARISNIRYAIAYLGLGEVSRIALALSVIRGVQSADQKELKQFWLHSYLTALTAKRVAKEVRLYDLDDLYTATLLHDIGTLVYQKFFPQHYQELVRWCAEHGRLLGDAERELGLPSHARLGSLLCDHWHLPAAVKRACEFHELQHLQTLTEPAQARPFDIVVPAANLLAALSADPLSQELKETISHEVRRVTGLDEAKFVMLMGDVYELKLKAEQAVTALL